MNYFEFRLLLCFEVGTWTFTYQVSDDAHVAAPPKYHNVVIAPQARRVTHPERTDTLHTFDNKP